MEAKQLPAVAPAEDWLVAAERTNDLAFEWMQDLRAHIGGQAPGPMLGLHDCLCEYRLLLQALRAMRTQGKTMTAGGGR